MDYDLAEEIHFLSKNKISIAGRDRPEKWRRNIKTYVTEILIKGRGRPLIRRRKNMDYGLAQAKDIYTYRAKIRFLSMERQTPNTAEEKCDLCEYKDSPLF